MYIYLRFWGTFGEQSLKGDRLVDNCPYCDWTYLGWEDELDGNDTETSNPVTINEAKKLVSEGKNIWGDPLPKR